jgi:hypothetical protein
MALIVSAASGNFNAPATWVGGVVPTVGDEAQAATGHTITITANTTCDLISNTGTGIFTLNDGVTLTANVINKSTTSNRSCLQFSSPSPAIAYIVGNCTGGGSSGGSVAATNNSTGTLQVTGNCTGGFSNGGNCHGVNNTSSGTITIIGNCSGGSVAGINHQGANNASAGTINITGNCFGGTGTGGSIGANNASVGTINITGNCFGGFVGLTSGQIGAQNNSTGTLNITGLVSAGSISAAFGASNNSTGILSIIGTVTSSANAAGVTGASVQQVTILSGPFITETSRGVNPVYCAAWRWNASPSNSTYLEVMTNNLLAKRNLVTADKITGMPAASNVRSGVSYASGALTGSCAVPAAGSVALGVPVDNTTGTAALTPAAVWEYATREITGGLVDTATTLTNTPNVPTTSQIASQVRTELSSELAKVAALNPTRLGQVTTTEILGNLLSQANS